MSKDNIEIAREKILNETLFAFAILGIPIIASSLLRTFQIGGWSFLFTWHIILGAFLWVLFFMRKYFSLNIKIFSLVISALITAILGAFEWGLFGAWMVIVVSAPVLITIFYGRYYGLIVLSVSACLLVVVAYLYVEGFIDSTPYTDVNNRSVVFWTNTILTIVLMILPLIVSIGKIYQILVHNIKELTDKTNELIDLKNDLCTTFEFIPIPILIFNLENEIVRLNKKFEKLFGYTDVDLLTLTDWYEKAFPDLNMRDEIINSWNNKLKNPSDSRLQLTPDRFIITGRDGQRNEMDLYFKLYGNKVMVLFNDMSLQMQNIQEIKDSEKQLRIQNEELLQLNQELLQSNDQITEMNQKLLRSKQKAEDSDHYKTVFLQNMSHEIRTPLNAIIGFTEMLSDRDLDENLRYSYLEIILASSNQLLDTVNDIISMSSIEAGRAVLVEEPININELFNSIIPYYEVKAKDINIQLSVNLSLPDSDAYVITDYKKVKQILNNLIGNAFKFTSKGKISVGYNLRSDFIVFYVKDTGIGIKHEYHQIIFDRFSKGDDSIARKYSGTGLGLSISKSFVEMIGGRIWLISEDGKGSTFFFTIPYKPFQRKSNIQ
ncbi:MAG: PAS domain-containing protein [Marinilabiliaceae bacterium]|nr:PAS domain-containing protein [Marinilabiliaceae bacterium]